MAAGVHTSDLSFAVRSFGRLELQGDGSLESSLESRTPRCAVAFNRVNFLSLLRKIDTSAPADLVIHCMVDTLRHAQPPMGSRHDWLRALDSTSIARRFTVPMIIHAPSTLPLPTFSLLDVTLIAEDESKCKVQAYLFFKHHLLSGAVSNSSSSHRHRQSLHRR